MGHRRAGQCKHAEGRQLVVGWVQVAEVWLDRLNRTMERLLSFFVYALVLVVTFEVVVRYFFGAPVI